MVLDSPWLTDWMQKNTKCLRHAFVQYGALLFRGFQIEDASAFEAVALAMVPNLEKEYLGTSPRSGIHNTTYVFTAADFQPHRTVPVHIEMSFRDFPPATQLFYAKRVDQWVGGETPLTDMQVTHHHDHGVDGHHHHHQDQADSGRGMSYSEHEETVTHTGAHGQGDGGHVTVRHHIISHQVQNEPHRQRYVPPAEPPDDLRLLDEPQVEPLQPKIIAGGLLAIFAQVYLWGNVFVTLFKPNRAPAQPGAPAPPGPAAGPPAPGAPAPAPEESAAPAPLVLFGAGGTLGDSAPVTRPSPTATNTAAASSSSPRDS
ncbi:unnamed protein product [Symbiodinium sp. CCMP2456]|nr:unnamed protein product [Symbiodinium sp. CCMP2456]